MYDRVENAVAWIEAQQQAQAEQSAFDALEQEITQQASRIQDHDPSVDLMELAPYVEREAAGVTDPDALPASMPVIFNSAYSSYRHDHPSTSPEPPAPATLAEAADSMMADFRSSRR